MKLMKGGTPIKKTMIHNDTQDATMVASDLQAGVTCYAKGQKVTGTGKSFEFANYGSLKTNSKTYIPSIINVVELTSLEYPVKHTIQLYDMKNVDFSTTQQVGMVVVDNIEYPISVSVVSHMLTISCEKTFYLQVFYGKNNYI